MCTYYSNISYIESITKRTVVKLEAQSRETKAMYFLLVLGLHNIFSFPTGCHFRMLSCGYAQDADHEITAPPASPVVRESISAVWFLTPAVTGPVGTHPV